MRYIGPIYVRRAASLALALLPLLGITTVAAQKKTGGGPPAPTAQAVAGIVTAAGMQMTWTAGLVANPTFPVGTCMAVKLDLTDNVTHDWPRTPNGTRVSLADFDMTATGPSPRAAVGKWSGPTNWSACSCQAALPGQVVAISAVYPAAALAPASRIPGVGFRAWLEVPLTQPQGTSEPTGCANLPVTTTVATTPPPTQTAPATATTTTTTTTVATAPAPVATAPVYSPPAGITTQTLPVGSPTALATPTTVATPIATPIATTTLAPAPVAVAPTSATTPSPTGTLVSTTTLTPVAAAPAPMSGNYLVTMTLLRAYQASKDDQLSRDGMGDEVYAAAYVRRYDRRTGSITASDSRKTTPYGDVNFFGAQRIQAGAMSATGGLADGDPVPAAPLVAARSQPAQDGLFPFRLWQGTLTDGQDALVINPTIWEQDGNNALYLQWVQQQQMLNLSIFTRQSIQDQIAQNAFGVLATSASGVNGSSALNFGFRTAADIALLGFGIPVVNLLQVSSDRPIGMVLNASAPDQTLLLNHTIVLTREIIEAALAQPALGMIAAPMGMSSSGLPTKPTGAMASIGVIAAKPGILMVHMQDGPMPGAFTPDRPAIYEMFIQVERVP